MTAFADDDPKQVGGLQLDVCFYPAPPSGTHDVYRWQIINLPSVTPWGEARQEGDQIFMVGLDILNPSYIYGMQWEIVSNDLGAGHWQYWKLLSFYSFSNVTFTRYHRGSPNCP